MPVLLFVISADRPFDRAIVLRHQPRFGHEIVELLVDRIVFSRDQAGDGVVVAGWRVIQRVFAGPGIGRVITGEIIADLRIRARVETDLAVGIRSGDDQIGKARIIIETAGVELEQVARPLRAIALIGVGRKAIEPGVEPLGAAVLIGEASIDDQCVGRRPAYRDPALGRAVAIGVVDLVLADIVDEAAIVADEDVAAHRKLILDQRNVDHAANIVAAGTMLGGRAARFGGAEEAPGIGLRRHEAHRARHRTRTEQRALRPTQHFDAVEIIDLQVRRLPLHRDRRVVEIDRDQRTIRRVRRDIAARRKPTQVELVEARRTFGDDE